MNTKELSAAFAGARILVTGGLGFIGSTLVRPLAEAGAEVVLVDSLIPEYGGLLENLDDEVAPLVRVNVSDVRDEYSLAHLVRGQDFVFNLAGQTSHLDSMLDPYTDLEINCRSQLKILEACRRHNPGVKIVFAGTRQIYGRPHYLPVDERHPIDPVDVNGINKAAGEWYHLVYGAAHGLRVAILRLTNTYGPKMRVKDARQTFLGYWFRLLVEGRELAVFGDGTQLRDFNFVDDVVAALLLVATRQEADGEIYNLGHDEVITLADLAALLVEVNGSGSWRLESFPEDRRRIDIGDYYGDYGKIRSQLGWEPRVRLAEGVARSLAFYRTHGPVYWGDE